MMRHRWSREGKPPRKVSGGHRAALQQPENATAARVGQGFENLLLPHACNKILIQLSKYFLGRSRCLTRYEVGTLA